MGVHIIATEDENGEYNTLIPKNPNVKVHCITIHTHQKNAYQRRRHHNQSASFCNMSSNVSGEPWQRHSKA